MDDVFWISITTILVGFFGLSMRMCLRSKCDKVECLCFKVHRNTNEETELPEPSPSGKEENLRLENIYRL
jgi:hypothetical protein